MGSDKSYNPTSFRRGFGNYEKDDEVYGFNGSLLDMDARFMDGLIPVTWKIDPQQILYPSTSPYVFTADNPIYHIDSDGEKVKITGEDAKATVAALQTKTSLKLTYDSETKMLNATGKPKTARDKKLLEAIKDENITVNLKTTRLNTIPISETSASKNIKGKGAHITIGIFDGSTVDADGKVETSQFLNLKQAEILEGAGGQSVGTSSLHELLESYIGAQDAPGMKIVLGGSGQLIFGPIHDKAAALDKKFQEATLKRGTTHTLILNNGKEVDIKYVAPINKESDNREETPEKTE